MTVFIDIPIIPAIPSQPAIPPFGPPPPPPTGGGGGGGGGGSPPPPPLVSPPPLIAPTSTATIVATGAPTLVPLAAAGGPMATLPSGFGLTVVAPTAPQTAGAVAGTVLNTLLAELPDAAGLNTAITAILGGLSPTTPVNVGTLRPTGTGATDSPFRIDGLPGGGQDLIIVDARAVAVGTVFQLTNIEAAFFVGPVNARAGADQTNTFIVGDNAAQILDFGAGDDTILGGGGNDRVQSDAGRDLLLGDAGDDTVGGGADTDTLFGGIGDDLLMGGPNGGEGAFEFLVGDGGNDTLQGEAGLDALFGREGDDSLEGGQGVDLLFGEAGNDQLIGGPGQDALVGGAGADRFVLTFDPTNANIEGIFDFNRAEGDKIVFTPFAGSPVGNAADAVLRQAPLSGGVLDGNGRMVTTIYTMIDFGTPGAPQVLLIGGNPTLVASDFVVGSG